MCAAYAELFGGGWTNVARRVSYAVEFGCDSGLAAVACNLSNFISFCILLTVANLSISSPGILAPAMLATSATFCGGVQPQTRECSRSDIKSFLGCGKLQYTHGYMSKIILASYIACGGHLLRSLHLFKIENHSDGFRWLSPLSCLSG